MAARGGLKSEFGFDLTVARSNLVAELVELGVVSQTTIGEWKREVRARAARPIDIEATRQQLIDGGVNDSALLDQTCEQWRSENRRRETLSEEEIEWGVARRIAERHARLHGIRAKINGEWAPHCETWPCKASGASYALMEISDFQAEQDADSKLVADRLAQLVQSLRRLMPAVADVEHLLVRQVEKHAVLARHIRLKPSPLDGALTDVRKIGGLTESLGNAHEQARERLMSKELRNARPGVPGRRKYWLLTAVSQHLAEGGYSQPRIAGLVPDDAGGSENARADRVRHRLADEDCRSVSASPPDE
jgi:hypothetical protein